MARIKPGVPTVKEIREGESEYRYIHGTGLVLYTRYSNQIYSTKMHAASTPPVMDKKLEMAIGDRVSSSLEGDEFIRADGTVQFTGNQSHGGHDIASVNDLDVDGDIDLEGDIDVNGTANLDNTDVDGTLDVDGHTTLDQVTVNTADGAFAVSGANPITLTTTGSNDIDITTAQHLDVGIGVDYQLDVTRTCDWNTATVDWDNSNTFDLTSVDDITIETSGAATDKTILLFNDNNHASAFHGIHLKTDSQNTGSCNNNILIECTNRASKGGGIGVDIASDDGILIRGDDANDNADSYVQIRATGCVEIGGGTTNISASSTTMRTRIHGVFETSNLFRIDATVPIVMDVGTILGGSATGVYTKFEALDTYKLMRAMTYRTSTTVAWETDATCHVTSGSPTVTHDSNDRILKGHKVTGTGIPANTFVGGTVSSTQFTLKNSSDVDVNATAGDGSEISLAFFNPSTVEEDNSIGIVNKDNDDNALGTVWMVTVYWKHSSSKRNLQVYWVFFTSSSAGDIVKVVEELDPTGSASSTAGVLSWTSGGGIVWKNEDSQDATVKASALRIQSGTLDF